MVQDFVRMTGLGEDEAIEQLTRGVPMKRVAEIDEVVEVILFAADPKNSFMTGHTLSVDGGIAAL
jgi:NAD(P)-dependent dehydrogenase (short-subunit alcohol dehydrogenase family)